MNNTFLKIELGTTLSEIRTQFSSFPPRKMVIRKRVIGTIKEDNAELLPEYCYYKNNKLITVYDYEFSSCYIRRPSNEENE